MKTPSFNFYPNNWLASSRIMTMLPEQEGAYIRLLAYQWNSENQTIPADDDSLAMLSRLGPRWNDLKDKILKCFNSVDGLSGCLRNERLFHEYERIARVKERQAKGGKQSANKRWHSDKSPISDLQVTHKTLITGNRELGIGNRELGNESRECVAPHAQQAQKQKPKRKKPVPLSDDEWMAALRLEYGKFGVDVDFQAVKAKAWAITNRREFTRRFFVNWLSRVDKKVEVATKPEPYCGYGQNQILG